jgi:glycosyltransferase involved in cell wall biosynthesis
VTCSWWPNLDVPAAVPEADVTIASFWHNAEWLRRASGRFGRKFYLIQEYEYYMTADVRTQEAMRAIFRSDLTLLAISPAVTEMLGEVGVRGPVPVIPNGIEHDLFYKTVGIADPGRCAIGFPTRPETFKGTADAILTLGAIRASFPTVPVWSFGRRRLSGVPDWVEFHERAPSGQLRDLYNRSLIFLVPSRYEGWGLPGAEAMACGAALVSTDNGGVRAYARHGDSALLASPGDVEALVRSVRSLLVDDDYRQRLAESGRQAVQALTWKRASERLQDALTA